MKLKKSLCILLFSMLLLSLLIVLSSCEQEAVPEVSLPRVPEPVFATASDAEILQQYPDDLDEALQELELVDE